MRNTKCSNDPVYRDLRIGYLTEDQKNKWKGSNIFYNTLFFDNEIKGPDVEFCKEAFDCYKRIDFYKDWGKWEQGEKYGLKNKDEVIRADLMTGWWNPTKYFLRIQGYRKASSKQLYEKCCESGSSGKNVDIAKWLSDEFGRSKEACKAYCEFLEVVYTEGNIIPIGKSYAPGSTLDGWDTKMLSLCKSGGSHEDFRKYVKKYFTDIETFVKENKLEDYYCDGKVVLFWDRTEKFGYSRAMDSEWEKYFTNAKNMIDSRNMRLRQKE